VLKAAGCDYVAAVHIGSKLAPRFAGNTPDTPTQRMRKPGIWETLVRVLDVQQKGLARLGSDDCDLLIAPDTSVFPFDDFTRGEELRAAGRAEAQAVLPRLKQALADLRQTAPVRKARAA
jgi:predicted acylesterase/phospholipase RssA